MAEASTPKNNTGRCNVCLKPASAWCSECKVVFYCTAEHLKADRKAHRKTCKPVTGSNLKMKAILFPAREDEPRLVEITYSSLPDASGLIRHVVDFEPWFGKGEEAARLTIDRHGMDGPPLNRTLTIYFGDNSLNNGSPLNQCVQRLAPEGHKWCGDMLVVRAYGARSGKLYSATVDDIEPVVEYLKIYLEAYQKGKEEFIRANPEFTFLDLSPGSK